MIHHTLIDFIMSTYGKSYPISNKKYKPEMIFNEIAYTIDHTFEYVDLCQVKDARKASVSRKRMIKILNKDTLELEQLIKVLPPEVYKIIAIDSGSLVACSNEEVLIFKYGNNKQYYFDKKN